MAANPNAVQTSKWEMRAVKDIADGLIALAAIAGGPAILLLAMDPLISNVPGISTRSVALGLHIGAIAIPLLPAISFVAGFRPKWHIPKTRVTAICLTFLLSVGVNVGAILWKQGVTGQEQKSAQEAKKARDSEEAKRQSELRRIVSEAVEEGIRRGKGRNEQ